MLAIMSFGTRTIRSSRPINSILLLSFRRSRCDVVVAVSMSSLAASSSRLWATCHPGFVEAGPNGRAPIAPLADDVVGCVGNNHKGEASLIGCESGIRSLIVGRLADSWTPPNSTVDDREKYPRDVGFHWPRDSE